MSPCVTSTWVISIPASSTISRSGSSTPFEAMSTPRPPSATREAFDVQLGCSARSMIITSPEFDHAADAVLRLHQLEPPVDLVEREAVGDERRGVDVAREPPVDEPRDAVAALDAAERRAGDAPPGDQVARDDVERLSLAG